MGNRSDERTATGPATDEDGPRERGRDGTAAANGGETGRGDSDRSAEALVDETDRLLEAVGSDESPADSGGPAIPDATPETTRETGASPARADEGTEEATPLWKRPFGLLSGVSPIAAVSPRSLLALALVLVAGVFVGSAASPFAGRTVGLFSAAFLVGLATSRRRYLEVVLAGASVGVATGLLDHALLAALGSGQRLVAIGAGTGLVTCALGYYFGRDLRGGLFADPE